MGFPGTSVVKNLPAHAGDTSLIPELGQSPEGVHGNPLHYSCLKIMWAEEPGRLQSMGLQRVGYHQACAHYAIYGIRCVISTNTQNNSKSKK